MPKSGPLDYICALDSIYAFIGPTLPFTNRITQGKLLKHSEPQLPNYNMRIHSNTQQIFIYWLQHAMYFARISPRHGSYPHGAYNLLRETDIQEIIRLLIKFTTLFYEGITTLISQLWKRQHIYARASTHVHLYEKYWLISVMNIDLKILNKIWINLM